LNNIKVKNLIIAAIIVATTIIYFQTVYHQLIYLDDDTLVHNKFEGLNLAEKITFSVTSNYLGGHYYRPVALFTFVTDSLIGGKSYFIYHLTNFLIHLFTSILIFLCIKKLEYPLIVSGFTALLFALNPIQINAVGWIAGRGDLLAAFFTMAALFIYLKVIQENTVFLLFFVFILLFLAILSKEVSLLVPFLFIPFYFIEKKELSLDKNSVTLLLAIFFVFISYYLLRGVFLPEVHLDKFSFTAINKNILVLPETISKFFIPFGVKALPRNDYFTAISGIIILFFLLLLPIKLKNINRIRYYFGLLWFVFLLIPGMVNRTMEQDGFYYWDCRSYLPLIGLLFIVAETLKLIDLKKYRVQYFILVAIYLLILGTVTFIKIKVYENPISYWNSVKADYPSNFLPYVGLYNYYNDSKDLDHAESQLLKAIEINPNDFSLRQILNNFYLVNNKNQKAFLLLKDTFNKKVKGSDSLIETYISLCIALDHLAELDELIAEYSNDNNIKLEIKQILIQKAKSLKEKGDNLKANLLLEKTQIIN